MAVIYDRGIRKSYIFIAALFAMFLFLSKIREPICRADEQANVGEQSLDFTSLSLEELKQVMIISVLKKPEKLTEATSAISVITQEDIRRSGATSIPELLRRVPGFQVAQMSSNTWAVSARGFNHRYANKLLVLMDGRSLYTPLFSGVYWNVQDISLEDIERIEVIRGPGATLWGANAVNGVINIITRKAKDTQGGLVTSGLGNELKRFSTFRYGGRWGDNAFGRVYLQYSERDSLSYTSGDEGNDQWDSLRGGFRIDRSSSEGDLFTLLGDMYRGRDGDKMIFCPPSPPPDPNLEIADTELESVDLKSTFLGGYLLGRWQHRISNTSDMTVQLYYDRTQQEKEYSSNSQYRERFDILDFDFQHSFKPANHHEIIWGLGYRFISDHFEARTSEMPVFILNPSSRKTDITSAFVQDGMDIIDDKLQLIAGSKFEHNDYTGFEVQPSLRLLLKLSRAQNLWTSISRAVRTPSRSEYDPVSDIGIDDPNRPPW
ncbi:MAG: TonB-dependent receptor plug domain-containing protein, partial [bacterium]